MWESKRCLSASLTVSLCIITGLLLQSCNRAYRFFPSSHHVTGFTKKNEVSAQVGVQNKHLAYSVGNHVALKASFITRNISTDKGFDQWALEHKKTRTGHYFDSELSAGYFNPRQMLFRESFLGIGFGKSAFHFYPAPYSKDLRSDFYSTNFSIYGQHTMQVETDSGSAIYITVKSKLMQLRDMHGQNLTEPASGGNIFPQTARTDFLWFNQVSMTYRAIISELFQVQGQLGLSFQNKYSKEDFRSLWLEFSLCMLLDKKKLKSFISPEYY